MRPRSGSTNGKPATASQVQLDQNDPTQTPSSSVNAVSYVQITIPAGSNGSVDLGELLAKQYGEQGETFLENLPKYDPDGYPYIYALREDTNLAGYETVYGTVGAGDTVTDTQPNYTDADGVQQELDQPDRSNDPFIYNNGTITNRLTGTVTVEATKTWEIAAFQDSLDTVTVTFTAQSRLASSTSDADWQDTDTTIEVDGWKAETLSQTFSGTFDRYDSQGRELEYRWIETGISIDGEPVEFKRDGAGGGSFTLTLENMEGEPEDLAFTSTFEEATDPDGTDTITNTFDNTTYERVDKYWQQSDGTLAQIKPQDADDYGKDPADLDTDGIATVQLFQDGVSIGTFEMDGTVDPSATEIKNLPGATYQETSSYHLEFEGLPKYDENGVRYTYLVLETPKDGWHVDRIYDAETHTTTINNTIGEGEGSEIRVIKQWNDGDDSSHRLPVVVDLVAVKPMTAEQNIDPATDKLYHYEPGDTVIEGIVLTAGESWYAEVDVPIGKVDYTYFKVVERGMGVVEQEDGSIEPQYPAVTYEEAEGAYQDISDNNDWINLAWKYNTTMGTERIATPDHVYRVTATENADPQYIDEMSAVTATNRRVGIFDLTIKKTWNDQGEHTRPSAELVVSCVENDEAFSVDENDGITVTAGGENANVLPVLDGNDNQLKVGEGSIYRVVDGKLIITVNTDDDEYESTYQIFGLPKYDGNGLVVHYDVEEKWENDESGEYTTTKTVGPYNVGERHFHDKQTISFTNTRQGTRSVTFNKLWQDQYVNESLRQRPDIYLTLYRVTVGVDAEGNTTYSEPEQVEGYVHYLWSGTPDAADPQYQQVCSIDGLPAYDENGSEYIYYASESMAADGASLDYTDVKFSYDGMATLHEDSGEAPAVEVPGAEQESEDPTENGTGWAIHEDGTFVNGLTDNLVARGTKLWEDVPANVNQGATGTMLVDTDLPEITVYLQQRVQGEDSWPSLKFEVAEDGNWSFADGTSAIAWTSDLKQVTTNQYSYSMAHTRANTTESVAAAIDEENPTLPEGEELLPRYTEDGKIYEYRAIEVVWGLVNQPGGVTSEWIKETDFSELRDSDDDSIGIYVIEHGETGSFLINNVYTSETGSLTVQKHYTGREAGDLYPETTFDVYRYYVNADGKKSDAALVDSVTLTNDMLKENGEQLDGLTVTGAGEAETTAKYTFSGLDIYAPDGSYWQYYVVEHNINGYKTTVGVGDLKVDEVNGTGETVDGGVSSGELCPESGTVEAPEPGGDSGDGTSTSKVTGTVLAKDEVAEDGTITPSDTTPDVTFKNEYQPGDADLRGTKTWSDFNNIFGIRPTVDEFTAGLKVERIGNGKTEDLGEDGLKLLQSNNPDEPYYFVVDKDPDNVNNYLITLSNVEKWAPDGSSYSYRITESLTGMELGETGKNADGYYTAANETSKVSAANPGSGFRFTNTLEGQATVEKKWNDGEDPYGLRPTTVTVRLQARYTYADGEPSEWQDPEDILNDLGYWEAFVDQFESGAAAKAFLEKKLSADTGWRGSWTGLPMGGRGTAEGHTGELFSIEYRAVEVAIGDQVIEQPTSADVTFTYTKTDGGEYHPYRPAQDNWTNTTNSSATTISNTLETTKISATKTWAGDAANGWDTRPGGDEWSVRYLLQRKLVGEGDEGWQWLMEYGAEQAELDEPFAEGIVSQTISGEGDSAVANWENLPDCDEDGTPYEYRVVEQVPGSYDVTDASAELVVEATEPTSGVTYRYYVVDSVEGGDAGDAQTFTNTLRTVELTGTKLWDDHGTKLTDGLTEADMPGMVLYRATILGNGKFGPTENVTSYAGQPEWDGSGDTWTFTYENLPAADEDNVDYIYWAVEKEAGAPGYYPLYGSDEDASSSGAEGTKVTTTATATQDGAQTNELITNVATRFTLDKVSDFTLEGENDPENLEDIELTIYGTNKKVYAVWTDEGERRLRDDGQGCRLHRRPARRNLHRGRDGHGARGLCQGANREHYDREQRHHLCDAEWQQRA